LAVCRQIDRAGTSDKQWFTQMLFELLHLMAQGALGHGQFLRCLDKAQVPGHGFKGA
jgi:hypothetical protein